MDISQTTPKITAIYTKKSTNGGLVGENIDYIYVDTKGNKLIGYGNGFGNTDFGYNGTQDILMFEGSNWHIYDIPTDESSWPCLNAVVEDKDGVLWFGTLAGLYKYNGKVWTRYYQTEEEERRLGRFPPGFELMKPIDISFEKLVEDPKKYHNKKVRIEGYYIHSFECSAFAGSIDKKRAVSYGPNFWVELAINNEDYEKLRISDGIYKLKAIGLFQYGSRYGHLGGYNYHFVITDILKIKKNNSSIFYLFSIPPSPILK